MQDCCCRQAWVPYTPVKVNMTKMIRVAGPRRRINAVIPIVPARSSIPTNEPRVETKQWSRRGLTNSALSEPGSYWGSVVYSISRSPGCAGNHSAGLGGVPRLTVLLHVSTTHSTPRRDLLGSQLPVRQTCPGPVVLAGLLGEQVDTPRASVVN